MNNLKDKIKDPSIKQQSKLKQLKNPFNNWQPIDIILLIITLIVGFSICFSIIKPTFSNAMLTAESSKLVAGIISSLVSIISIYVGSKLKK